MAKALSLYFDVKEILDAALSSLGGTYSLPSHGAAVHWRQRAYAFRKAFRDQNPDTPYDRLTFPKIAPDSSEVVIKMIEQRGTFIPNKEPVPEPEPDISDLITNAADLLNSDIF